MPARTLADLVEELMRDDLYRAAMLAAVQPRERSETADGIDVGLDLAAITSVAVAATVILLERNGLVATEAFPGTGAEVPAHD